MSDEITAVVYNKQGEVVMIIHPDNPSQLSDPAFNPPDCVQVQMPRDDYKELPMAYNLDGVAVYSELSKVLIDDVAAIDSETSKEIQKKIDEVDAAIAEDAIPVDPIPIDP